MLRVLSIVAAVRYIYACTTDGDCWMNGDCVAGVCQCDPGWKGPQCLTLDLVPLESKIAAYGYAPNVTSWGGRPIEINGTWHMQVSEMVNGCGLAYWQTNSRVVHVTSKSMLGPYQFQNVSLPYWTHTPQVAVDISRGSPEYLMYHVGNGKPNGRPAECGKNNADRTHPTVTNGLLHKAPSPSGPWTPVDSGLPDMFNPAPYIFPNGTTLVVSNTAGPDWLIYKGDTYRGPWKKLTTTFKKHLNHKWWEDPFLWWDEKRQVFKLLSHAYWDTRSPLCTTDYSKYVSGFGYSKDLVNWEQNGEVEPFSSRVEYADGSSVLYNTRERPQLILDKQGQILALVTGIGGVPMPYGCKNTAGVDWTFTLVQKVNTRRPRTDNQV